MPCIPATPPTPSPPLPRALLHFLDPYKFGEKEDFAAKYKHLLEHQSEKEVRVAPACQPASLVAGAPASLPASLPVALLVTLKAPEYGLPACHGQHPLHTLPAPIMCSMHAQLHACECLQARGKALNEFELPAN